MIGSTMQSFLYGLGAVGTCAIVILICSGVRSICRKILKKRGKKHDDR